MPAAPRTSREALVAAAAELLDEGGPAAVTLRAVARKAGVSHNAPYNHFHDKEALLAAVAAGEFAARAERDDGAGPMETVRRMALDYVRWARRYPNRFKLVFGPWETRTDDLGEAAAGARTRFIAAVAAAQAAGALKPGDPERVAALIQALGHGAADLALGGHLARDGKGAADPEDLLDDLLRLLAR